MTAFRSILLPLCGAYLGLACTWGPPAMRVHQAPVQVELPETPFPVVALGGVATVHDAGPNAFGYPSPHLDANGRRAFVVGNSFFKQNWVIAPASAEGRDGLGPFFDARSCSACHFKDGRGRPPVGPERHPTGLLFKLNVPGPDGVHGPHPVYGGQLQPRAIQGMKPEARFELEYEEVAGEFGDGTPYTLQRPVYRIVDERFGPMGDVVLSPRVGSQIIGMGLLEAVPVEVLEALADPEDADGDGISGRIHWVVDGAGDRVPGRFAWKAEAHTVRQQVGNALRGDMGITSPVHPTEDLTAAQLEEVEFASGGDPEINDHKLGRLVFYTAVLAVPARRNAEDPVGLKGEKLFMEIGCADCHTPTLVTGRDALVEGYENQVFHPFSDLLLHDMGPGLADGVVAPGDGPGPQEWRTPPLWGIGLVATVNEHTRFLHDGRARSVEEAVLWHGGEAEGARERYRGLGAEDRAAVLRFVGSL